MLLLGGLGWGGGRACSARGATTVQYGSRVSEGEPFALRVRRATPRQGASRWAHHSDACVVNLGFSTSGRSHWRVPVSACT